MKIFTLLISFLFASLNIFAQEPDSVRVEEWNDVDFDWENEFLTLYSYSNSQLLSFIGKEYDTDTGEWLNYAKQESEYSVEGYLIQNTTSFWDEDLNDWDVEYKAVYTNNSEGHPTTVTTTGLEDGSWFPLTLSENIYNAEGLLAESTYQVWDDYNSEYENTLKMFYTYDPSGNQTLIRTQAFHDPEWVNLTQTSTEYTSFNAEEIVTRQSWNADSNEWMDTSKRTYTYNADQSTDHSTLEKFNPVTGEWENDEQDLYTNNPDGSIYQVVTQEYDSDSNEWENDIRTTISYPFTSAVYSANPLVVGVFPNPTSTAVNIQLGENAVRSTYTIIDMNGKIIANDSFYGSNAQISMDRFAAGIYMFQVEANGKTGIVRIVRE